MLDRLLRPERPRPPRSGPVVSRAAMLRLLGLAVAAAVVPIRGGAARAAPLRVRRNAKLLSATEKERFVAAVKALKRKASPWRGEASIYDEFARWHSIGSQSEDVMPGHMGSAFLPWHRMLTLLFEQQLQAVDPSVTIPYWDWAADSAPDAYLWRDDFLGGDGDPDDGYAVKSGPFRAGAWEITVFDRDDVRRVPHLVRAFGTNRRARRLPTVADVREALSIPTYDVPPWDEASDYTRSFRGFMEGWRGCREAPMEARPNCSGLPEMHNRVHEWVAGSFGDPDHPTGGTLTAGASPNDPVFWLHHSNIDRLWVAWQRRYGLVYLPIEGGQPGHNLRDRMWPFSTIGLDVTPEMMLDHRALGYRYDDEEMLPPIQLPPVR